jgi:arginine/serine-rich splicing factor 7
MALFIGRIPMDTRVRELEDVFIKYGRIIRCDVKRGTGM